MKEVIEFNTVAEKLNKLHGQVGAAMKSTIPMVLEMGETLLSVKESLPHGEFGSWVEENLFFSLKTAQNYMSVYRKRELVEAAGADLVSQAYAAIKPPREPEEKEEIDVSIDPDHLTPPPEYDYWPVLSQVVEVMDRAYQILSSQRTTDTPEGLYNLIGNLYEMTCRLAAWEPQALTECDACEGAGFTLVQNNGKPVEERCPICINGKCGPYKESQF